jgi:hypothetical protein
MSRLHSLLVELRPYLDDMVLIGGWVPYLYQRFGGFADWTGALSQTEELDVLLPASCEQAGRQPLAHILIGAGLRPANNRDSAAVWQAQDAPGPVIEFFVDHQGTAKQMGTVQQIDGQPSLGAIALQDLALLSAHSDVLTVPAPIGEAHPIGVRVPTLGAYVLHKCLAFRRRARSIEAGKDAVYLRDIMAGGATVRQRVGLDLQDLANTKPARMSRAKAACNIRELADGHPKDTYSRALEELRERDSLGALDAELDFIGHLDLLHDILKATRSRP